MQQATRPCAGLCNVCCLLDLLSLHRTAAVAALAVKRKSGHLGVMPANVEPTMCLYHTAAAAAAMLWLLL
jgi:hypothetical protein